MASKVQDGGYDLNFVEDVPEDLLCVICHLALRRPVQVIECGHKFCECCFASMKVFSASRATDLCCPLDREVIDTSKVFPDKFMERKVFDLQVKCDNIEKSCKWTGEMRSLQVHLNVDCLYQVDTCEHLGCGVEMERGKLNEHMETCDKKEGSGIMELLHKLTQEIRINEQKFQSIIEEQKAEIVELKNGFSKQQAECVELKTDYAKQRDELDRTKEQCDKVQKLEGEVENHKKELERYNEMLRTQDDKIRSLENKIERQNSDLNKVYVPKSELTDTRKIVNEQQVCLNSMRSMLNILSHENPVFIWKIENYWEVNKDKALFSPFFYTSFRGYQVYLFVQWFGEKKGRMGVYLGFGPTQYWNQLEWPFKKKWTIVCVDKTGKERSISYDGWGLMRGTAICSDMLHETGIGEGDSSFLNMPELKNYVINNCLTLKCWFK